MEPVLMNFHMAKAGLHRGILASEDANRLLIIALDP